MCQCKMTFAHSADQLEGYKQQLAKQQKNIYDITYRYDDELKLDIWIIYHE